MTPGSTSGFSRRADLLEFLPNLRRFAYSLSGSRADADDLMQATVERVLQRGLPADAELAAWCLKVCRNLWIDEYRSRKVRTDAAQEDALADWQSTIQPADAPRQVELAEVDQAMNQLAPEQREVLALVVVEGYTYQQAADLLEVPIGTVMSRLSRARSALAKSLRR